MKNEKSLQIGKEIFNELYLKYSSDLIEVFLCGGASYGDSISFRDQLRGKMKDYKKNIRILYPEDLFMEILHLEKHDLLKLECFLGDNTDWICIVCESPGSFVELGAFVNHTELSSKVIILTDIKYKKEKSFINEGPLKYLKTYHGNERVIYYNKNKLDDTFKILMKQLKQSNNKLVDKKMHSITEFYTFISFILYFLKKLDYKNIKDILLDNFPKYLGEEELLNKVIMSSLKLLFKENMIYKDSKSYYFLTDKGRLYTRKMINKIKKIDIHKYCDKIGLDVIKNRHY